MILSKYKKEIAKLLKAYIKNGIALENEKKNEPNTSSNYNNYNCCRYCTNI